MSVARARARPAPALGSELEFLRLLWRLEHALQRHSKRLARELGLTGPQALVLRIVGRFPGLPAGELAALLHLHPSTLTGVLQRLERRGWIRRRIDPKDRRRALFGLTERGRALEAADPLTIENAVRAVLHGAEGDSRAVLLALAQELERTADEPQASA